MKKFESVKWFERLMILLLALVVIAFLVIVPLLAGECGKTLPELSHLKVPFLIYCIVTAVPIVWALVITISVCRELYREDSFTRNTSKALLKISTLALIEAAIILIWGVLICVFADQRLLLSLAVVVLILAAAAAALFCRVLSKIIDNALDIKEESEYTI